MRRNRILHSYPLACLWSAGTLILLLLLLTGVMGCGRSDSVLLVTVGGAVPQRVRATLLVSGKRLDPAPMLRGDERKFALSVPADLHGSADLVLEGFPDTECMSALGSTPVVLNGERTQEVKVRMEDLPVEVCRVDTALLTHVQGVSERDIWAVGDHGAILRWDGARWQDLSLDAGLSFRKLWPERADSVWFAGSSIWRFDGRSFAQSPSTTSSGVHAIGGDAGELWAAGEKGDVLSLDGSLWSDKDSNGARWSPIPLADVQDRAPILRDIAVTSDGSKWILGDDGNLLRWSRDTPRWTRIFLGPQDDLQQLVVKGGDAWLIGLGGNIWKYAGGRWTRQELEGTVTVKGVRAGWAQDAATLWLAGDDGLFQECQVLPGDKLRCIDRQFVDTVQLHGLWGSGTRDLWIVGGDGTGDLCRSSCGVIYRRRL